MGLLFLVFCSLLPLTAICFYLAAARTRAVTNASILLLRTIFKLQGLNGSDDTDCVVEPCPEGIVVKQVVLPDKLLKLATGAFTVQSVSIKVVHLLWATSSSPVTLCVTGVAISVLQRQTAPKVQSNARPVQRHAGKLKALESLLWDGRHQGGVSGWRGRQLHLLRFFISRALRNISVVVADVEFQYQQTGDPAPVLKLPEPPGIVDAVSLTIRSIEVSPARTYMKNQGQAAAERRDAGPYNGTETSAAECSTTDNTAAGPPPSVQQRLYRWRDALSMFPKIQALYNWLASRIAAYQPVGDCNISRVTVAGVNLALMSKTSLGSKRVASAVQQQAGRQQTCQFRSSALQRLRGRSSGTPSGRASATQTRALADNTGKCAPPASAALDWDSAIMLLRQWSIQVDVFVDPSQTSHNKRPATRSGQPLALHIQGFFGIRGHQRSVKDFLPGIRDAQHNAPVRATGSFPRRMGCPAGGQPYSSVQGLNRHVQPPSSLSRSSSVFHPAQAHQASVGTDAQGGASTATTDTQASGARLVIHVDVRLKAFVPEMTPEAADQLLRMLDRLLTYDKYSVYWSQRPSFSVTQSPAAWWQHAGRAVINDCREHFPLRSVRVLMARRAEYIRAYKELHSMQYGFVPVTYQPLYMLPAGYQGQPTADALGTNKGCRVKATSDGVSGLRKLSSSRPAGADLPDVSTSRQLRPGFPTQRFVFPRSKPQPGKLARLLNQLVQLESQLPLGQIMCNRTFVALWHSSKLRDARAQAQWLEAMGVITNFVDAIPTMDEEELGTGVASGFEAAAVDHPGDDSNGLVHHAPAAARISLCIHCPRVGVKLINRHTSGLNTAALLGGTMRTYDPRVESKSDKRPADVLGVMLEDIIFFMPDIYRISLQAATMKASLLSGAGGGPRHVLIVPASRECMDLYGVKLDFSAASQAHCQANVLQGPLPGNSKSWAAEGAIYPDAPLSLYLSRYKVRLAAVEVALSNPPMVVAAASFIDSMVQLKAAGRRQAAGALGAVPDWPSTNLHSLVMDSYMRNRVRLPSSMAVFMPKLQFFCPLVSVRWMLSAGHTPSIGGISGQKSEALTVAVTSNVRVASRYVHTCYGSLVQSTSVQAHVELYFQLQPRVESHSSAPRPGVSSTHFGNFTKMWLHPDDVELAFPTASNLHPMPQPQGTSQLKKPSQSSKRVARSFSRNSQGSTAAGTMPSLATALTSASEVARADPHSAALSYPFLPLLKIRSFSAIALNQVPYEPAVPGTMTAHHTVGVHSVMAWFSPWHAKVINGAMDSILTHPVLAHLRKFQQSNRGAASECSSSSAATAAARKDTSACEPAAVPPSSQPTPETSISAVVGGGSSISLLVDVPLLTINCYAEMPKASGVLGSNLHVMKSGEKLQLPAWVTKQLAFSDLSANVDPVVRWGLHLTPLLTMDITNLRSGLRLTRSNSVMARLQMTGLLISDQQARLKRFLYANVWLANSGRGSPGPASESTVQLLGPLATRAAAVVAFARERRRAAVCLSPSVDTGSERLGQLRQQWRRLLEVQLLHRASDFAMFLLSATHRSAARQQVYGIRVQPLENYRILFQQHMKETSPQSASLALSTSPSEPSTMATNSPSGSGTVDSATATINRFTPMATRNASGRFRSIGALFSRSNRVTTTPYGKSTSFVQMLGAVNNQTLHRMVTLRHTAALLVCNGSGTESCLPGAPARDVPAFARASMERIPEDVQPAPSDAFSFTSSHPQHANGLCAAHGFNPSKSRAGLLGSNEPGCDSLRGLGRLGSLPAAVAPVSPMHSAFMAATEQSRAATQGRSAGSTSPLTGASEADAKLSFVQSFRHLGSKTVQQRRRAFVYNMPLPNPVVKVTMTQAAGDKPAALHAGCDHLISCVGVHSVGSILLMVVQIHQALRSPVRAGKTAVETSSSTPSESHSSSGGLRASINLGIMRMKVVMEEPPRRVVTSSVQPDGELGRQPGLTELTSIELRALSAKLSPELAAESSAGRCMELDIDDIYVLDLQGCVEHRNVLVAKPFCRPSPEGHRRGRQHAASWAGSFGPDAMSVSEEDSKSWSSRVRVVYLVSPIPDAHSLVRISVHDLCVTWLRRYSNNIAYAVGVITEAYRLAVQQSATADQPASSEEAFVHHDGQQTAAGTAGGMAAASTAKFSSPGIFVEAFNLKAVLPGGAAARHGPIRRAVHNEALAVEVESSTVYIPGGAAGPAVVNQIQRGGLDEGAVWLTSADEVDRLVLTSLRLGMKHFPQVDQQPKSAEGANVGSSGNEGGGLDGRQRKPHVETRPAGGSSPGNLFQKHLQAAKANFIDPLKEILQEAGHKRTKQHGEVGFLLINEGPARGPTGAVNPGYLKVEDEEGRRPAAAPQHTTTTVRATLPRHATSVRGPSAPVAAAGAPQEQHEQQCRDDPCISSSQTAGLGAYGSSAHAVNAAKTSSTTSSNDGRHSAMVLISISGFSATTCKIVPYDNTAYRRRRPAPQETSPQRSSGATAQYRQQPARVPQTGPLRASSKARDWMLPVDLCNAILYAQRLQGKERLRQVDKDDPEVESALDLLADTELQSVQPLIDPVHLKGVVFHHAQHGAVQVHFSALGAMVATLGPERYERMIKVLSDNVSEAFSCFNVGAVSADKSAQRRTAFGSDSCFAPRPGQLPFFHLTVEWLDHLRVLLESDPAWWKPSKEPGQGAEPCLQSCFTQSSLGLMMVHNTNDMFLAFLSQQLHVADVRISTHDKALDATAVSAVYPLDGSGFATSADTTADLTQTDASQRPSTDGRFRRALDGAETLCDEDEDEDGWTAGNVDGASTETPDSHNVQPVVDDQLGETFPGMAAVVTLLRSNIDLPANESAHLAGAPTGDPLGSGECPRDGQHNCVRVSFAIFNDGTMGNEIELCHTLVQWPYLTEMSLISSIIAIFLPSWGCPASGPEAQLRLAATPWLYFNLLLRNSQVYVPVLAPHLRHLTYGWRAAASQAAGDDIHLTPEKLQQLFASMAEDAAVICPTAEATAFGGEQPQRVSDGRMSAVTMKPLDQIWSSTQLGGGNRSTRTTASPLGDPILSGNWGTLSMRHMAGVASSTAHPGRLEQMGVVISMAALRVGYFSGGDGEGVTKVDLRNAAGFLRHGNAQVTNWLLPIRSMVLEYRCSSPMVEESRALEGYILTARVIMRHCLRMLRGKVGLRQADDTSVQSQNPHSTELATRMRQDKIVSTNDVDGVTVPCTGVNMDDAKSVRSRAALGAGAVTAQDFLVEQATNRAAGLLELHKLPLPTSSASRVAVEKLVVRKPSASKLTFELDTAVIRAAFSNIPLWHALMEDASLAAKLVKRNSGIFSPAPAIARGEHKESRQALSEAALEAKATWSFRPNSMLVHANMKSVGLVLCDDKPKSYGAPDVLTAAMEDVAVQYSMEKRFWDHLPEQLGCIFLRLAAQFLNNSTGRWEHLLEPWPAELHLSDPINPVFKSSRTKYVFVSSNEFMKLTFHPSCLLTLGDTFSFVRRLAGQHDVASGTAEGRSHKAAPVAEDPPSVNEQMALLSGSILTRVPQRYLIQNYTGLMMSYWAPKADSDVQPASGGKRVLPSGCSEELQVTPTAKQVKIVGPGGVVLTRLQAQVIVLNFEGTWMPISDVSVDVVGKYCYDLHSPTDDRHAPVVVDVALVGRTKILKIHSALYVQNGTSLRLSFKLHFPSILLASQVVLGAGDQRLPGDQDIKLRPLKPGEGRYLPVVAALGGSLYLEARTQAHRGLCVYGASKHDVIRLSPNVTDMLGQGGFIATGPPLDGHNGIYANSPLHFAVKIRVKTRTEYSYTNFHSMEVPGPGLFAKASRPLEASIKICPTVELTNSLPYHMEGYLISLNRTGKEPEPTTTAANTQAMSKPPRGAAGSSSAPPGGVSGNLPATESKRLLKAVPETDQDRILSVFERSLLPMLNQKAKHIWDARRKQLGTAAPNDRKKCFLLALLRYELRWTAKRSAKETELLVRTDTEPADKITWQELEAFLDWARHSIRLVNVQPGETQHLYLDMHKPLVMCIKVPERKLVCTRPVEVNYGSSMATNGEADLPDFMRLDYIDDTGKGFSDVWDKMKSGNHVDTQMNFVKVVNQQFRDTAAAVGDKVVNTVRGVRDAALDVFSGPHTSKAAQPSTLSGVVPLDSNSATYWQENPDRVVRVQLFVSPGLWHEPGDDGTGLRDRRLEGTRSADTSYQNEALCPSHKGAAASPAGARLAVDPGGQGAAGCDISTSTVPRPSKPAPGPAPADELSPLALSAATRVGAPGAITIPDSGSSAGQGPLYPASPFSSPIAKSTARGTDQGSVERSHVGPTSNNGIAGAGMLPLEPTATSSQDTTRPGAVSPSVGALPPVRSIFDRLRSSMVLGKHQDLKGSSPARLAGKDGFVQPGGPATAAGPHPDEHVRVRFTYRPDGVAPAQSTMLAACAARRPQAAFHTMASQDLGFQLSRAKGGIEIATAVSPTSRPYRSFEDLPLIYSAVGPAVVGLTAHRIVQLQLRIVRAASDAPERVRVLLVVTPAQMMDDMAPADDTPRTGASTGAQCRAIPIRLPVDNDVLYGPPEEAARPYMLGMGTGSTAAEVCTKDTLTPNSGIPATVISSAGSPFTPQFRSYSGASLSPSHHHTVLTTTTSSDASPGSVLVPHSGQISTVNVPGGSAPIREARTTSRPEANVDHKLLIGMRAGGAAGVYGAPEPRPIATVLGGCSPSDSKHRVHTDVIDTVRSSRGSLKLSAASSHRPDPVWSENAAYKCGSSVSTTSGSDLPRRVPNADFEQCDDAFKAGAAQDTCRIGARHPLTDGLACTSTSDGSPGTQRPGSSSAPYLDGEAPAAVGAPSVAAGAFSAMPTASLGEGYAHLELFQASLGSPISRVNRFGRRSPTLSSSLSLRRVPSMSPRSTGSARVSGGMRDGDGSNMGAADQLSSEGAQSTPSLSHLASPIIHGLRQSAVPVEGILGSPFFALGRAVGTSSSMGTPGREGDKDLSVINEATTSDAAGANGLAGGAAGTRAAGSTNQAPQGRRFTADDVIGSPRVLESDSGSGEFVFDARHTEAFLVSAAGRQVQSEKRIGERVYSSLRFPSRLKLYGIGKKGSGQPSYKAFAMRSGRTPTNAIELAKSAIQVVPRLPNIARNVGGMVVDGGHQVLQGVPQVASFVADTIIAGGQGVKDKVVESTGQAIKIAKPKIQKGLMAIAWKATEAMRKRKQGSDDVTMLDDPSKPPRAGRRRAEVERAPKVLLLSVHNSLATKEEDYVCRLSIYAAYWVDNRTGFNLVFKDLDAPAGIDNLPFLLWHPVEVPGNKADAACYDSFGEQPGSADPVVTPRLDKASVHHTDRQSSHGAGSAGPFRRGCPSQSAGHKPALLNDQMRTRFRIHHPQYSETDFCVAFTIATPNQKYSVDIKGEKGDARVLQGEAIGAGRLSAHGRRAKLAQSPMFEDDSRQTADTLPKAQISASESMSGLHSQNRAATSSEIGVAPVCNGQSASSEEQQQQQAHLEEPHGPPGMLAGQTQESCGGAGLLRSPGAADGFPGEPKLSLPADAAAGGTGAQVELPVPCVVLGVEGLEGRTPATLMGAQAPRDDATFRSALPPSIVVARRPLETVCEITPVEDEGPSTPVISAMEPMPPTPEHSRLVRVLGLADASLECDQTDCLTLPQKTNLSTVAVSLSGETHLGSDEARVSSNRPAAVASTLPSSSAITSVADKNCSLHLAKARSSRSVEDGIASHPYQEEASEFVPVRRLYRFAVEVWAAPSDTVFGRTKIITVKNKYLILNATGRTIEYKQKGTPDPDFHPTRNSGYGKGMRFSRRLLNNARAAWHWDNVFEEQELMIRPAGDEWEWSGSFELPELEDYFGLRVRHRHRDEYVIIPVNISVGPAGSVLITLKSIGSVPPYMIINRCRDVVIHLKQADYSRDADGKWDDWDVIQPGSNQIPFAWDEPRLRHVVKVVATAKRGAAPDQASAMDVDLDAVDVNTTIYVQSRSTRTLSLAAQLDAREKAKFLTDNAKKVYVTVYADGPTRVLCFSEDRSGVASLDDENSLLNLSYRLQRVGARLKEVDQKLVQQLGGSLDPVLTVRQQAEIPCNGSQQGAPTSEEARFQGQARFGSFPGAAQAGFTSTGAGRHGMPQAAPTSSGTATPPSTRVGPSSQGSLAQASFAFQRLPSVGQRVGTTSVVPPSYRQPSIPSSAALLSVPPAQRVYQTRRPSHQAYACKLAGVMDGQPSYDGERSGRVLESLPTSEGYVDLPIGGDLTVIFRCIEGLSSSLNSNEKLVAVEAKMAVVSSCPDLDSKDSQRKVTASWPQTADAVSGSTGAVGDGCVALEGSSGGAVGCSSNGGLNSGFGQSWSCAGRFTLQDYTEVFRDIAASSELHIDFYIAKGTEQSRAGHTHYSHAARQKGQQAVPGSQGGRQGKAHVRTTGVVKRDIGSTVKAPHLAVSSGQFAGCVRIPLMSTIECDKNQVWRLALERKTGSQLIRGYASMSFQWSLTNEGMLVREVTTLERILDEKIELLAQLSPLPVSVSNAFVCGSATPANSVRQDAATAVTETVTAASLITADKVNDSTFLGQDSVTATGPVPHAAPIRKTAKALTESYYVNLELSVLEISGLLPREGLRASIAASMYGRQTANLMSTAMLPRAFVSMSCGSEIRTAAAGANSVNPRFPKNMAVFQNVPLGAKVSLKISDQMSGSYHNVLAEAAIHLSQVPSTDPVYAWLALKRCKHGSGSQHVLALLMVMEEEGDADVQMLMRIRISKPQVYGVALKVTLDLAGVGLCAKTNLEELFNYTMQKIRTSLVQTRTDVQVSLVVQAIQLDNQMLEAKNPVVLSAADVSGSSSLAQARRRHKARLAQRVESSNPVLRIGNPESALQDPLLIFQVIYNQASSNHAMVNSTGQEDSVGILAFKKVILELGPLDFSADQEFIEGVVAYLNGIPLADFYQDRTWQQKIDAMQSGTMTPLGGAEDLLALLRRDRTGDALEWLAAKEANELEFLRGQSSMWFYLEEFYLSDVFINVTLALSSSFNAGGSASSSKSASGKEEDRQRSIVRGFLSRVSGSNGFQLINVTNVPIQLEYVELQNHLVNRVSLVNKLYRHYSWIAIGQARKVLGGAGPAIAAIPASLLWASIALFDLGQDVAAKRVNPLVVPTRIGYITFTLMGQVIGVMSRTMCAIMGLLPPRFSSDTVNLSDSETSRRFGIKPQTLMDALYLSQRDVLLGLMSAAFGVVHDTAAGVRWKGGLVALGVPMGVLKASLGLGVRPAAGAVEATSKLLQGLGLMCLGKRGIQGKLVRRMQAPGLAVTDVVQAARASAAQAAIQSALIAAWQAALPAISPTLADDEVVDVVAARSTRVVLLTNRHLAYLYARRHAAGASASSSSASQSAKHGVFSVTYKVKWIIPNGRIDNIRGLDRGYAVSVEYHKPVKLGRLSLKLPLHKGMRTATAEGHKDLIFRLNRHIGRAASRGELGVGPMSDGPAGTMMTRETSVPELSIMGG